MFNLMFYIVPIFIVIVLIVMVGMFFTMLNPKTRGKMMSKQIKASKYMLEEAEDDLEDIKQMGKNILKK